jgi:hypothetical protein
MAGLQCEHAAIGGNRVVVAIGGSQREPEDCCGTRVLRMRGDRPLEQRNRLVEPVALVHDDAEIMQRQRILRRRRERRAVAALGAVDVSFSMRVEGASHLDVRAGRRRRRSGRGGQRPVTLLEFLPLPHGHGSLRPATGVACGAALCFPQHSEGLPRCRAPAAKILRPIATGGRPLSERRAIAQQLQELRRPGDRSEKRGTAGDLVGGTVRQNLKRP